MDDHKERVRLLQQEEPELVLAGLEVLKDRNDPLTRPILLRLLHLLVEAEWSLQEEGLRLLLARGPEVLAMVMEIAQQDSEMDDLVFHAFAAAGKALFAQPREALDGIILDHLIPQLAQYPQEVVPALVFVLEQGLKEWWEIAIQTLERIGWPANAVAIPLVIAHASDYNSPSQGDALHLLTVWGPERVVPYLLDGLWDDGRSGRYAWARLWHIAEVPLRLSRNPAYVQACGPLVSLLLNRAPFEPPPSVKIIGGVTFKSPSPVNVLLRVLETIGPACATYALPTLLDLIQREGTSELAQRARRLLVSFDAGVLAPYRLLMDSLGISLEGD